VVDGEIVAMRHAAGGRGHAALLAPMADEVLKDGGGPGLDGVAVTVGPGSFTGLRAAISLAQGIAAGAGVQPDDMMILLYEVPGENASFGQGEAQRANAVKPAIVPA
jgi:hypothetical protein